MHDDPRINPDLAARLADDLYPTRVGSVIPGTCTRCGFDVDIDPDTLPRCETCSGRGIDPRDELECEQCIGTGREYPEDDPVLCARCAGIMHPALTAYERSL